jgi:hypothetical protein
MLRAKTIFGSCSSTVLGVRLLVILCASGCAVTRKPPQLSTCEIQQIQVFDYRLRSVGSKRRFLRTIEDERGVEQVVALIGKYRDDWSMLSTSMPTGELRLTFVGRDVSGNKGVVAEFVFTRSGVVTSCEGGAIRHDVSQADREELCRVIGLDDSFFNDNVQLFNTGEPGESDDRGVDGGADGPEGSGDESR